MTSEPLALAGDVHSEGTPGSSTGRRSSEGRDPGLWPASRSSGRSLGTSRLPGLLPRRPCVSRRKQGCIFYDLWQWHFNLCMCVCVCWTDYCSIGPQSLLDELIHKVGEIWVAASYITGDWTGFLDHLLFVCYTQTHTNTHKDIKADRLWQSNTHIYTCRHRNDGKMMTHKEYREKEIW